MVEVGTLLTNPSPWCICFVVESFAESSELIYFYYYVLYIDLPY